MPGLARRRGTFESGSVEAVEIEDAGLVHCIALFVEAGFDLVLLGGYKGEVVSEGVGAQSWRAFVIVGVPRS